MEQNKLAKLSNELSTTEPLSAKDLALMQCLDLAAKVNSYELATAEVRLWKKTLKKQPIPAIEWAFLQHATMGTAGWTGFPKPSHILDWCGLWHRQAWESADAEQRSAEEEETKRRLAQGEVQYGIDDVKAAFREIVDKHGMGQPVDRNELKARLDKAVAERKAKKQSA